jgi:hypothetical protein
MHSATMERQKKSKHNLQIFLLFQQTKKLQGAMEHISELTSGSRIGVELAKMLTVDSPSRDQL